MFSPPRESFTPPQVAVFDLATGRREQTHARADRPLTSWGLAVAISLLFCLPVGGAFLGKFDTSRYFWTSAFAWLAIAAYSIPLLIAGLAKLTGKGETDTVKSLLLREAIQDTTTTTVKTREPSSIDFKKVFAMIAGYLLGNERHCLVVVIDNLDRIDAASAVTMWATMRVFFDLDQSTATWKNRVWLIVPFDRSALSGLWQSADPKQAADFVDSFLHKTFQITFHVSPAVLTAWKHLGRADRAELLVDYLGISQNQLTKAVDRLAADGKYELAASLLESSRSRFEHSRAIAEAERHVYPQADGEVPEYGPVQVHHLLSEDRGANASDGCRQVMRHQWLQ